MDYYVIDDWLKQPYWEADIFAGFRALHPNVSISPVPWQYPERFTKLSALAAAGSAPDFSHWYHPAFAFQQLTVSIDGHLKRAKIDPSDFFDSSREYITMGGRLHAYPYRMNALLTYYNRDLLASAGMAAPPRQWGDKAWTWDTFFASLLSLTTTASDGTKRWGWDNLKEMYQYPWYYGEDWLTPDRSRLALKPDGSGAAHLQRAIDQITRFRTSPTAADRQQYNMPFRVGRAAFTLDFISAAAELNRVSGLKWGVAPNPKGTHAATVGYTDAWVLLRGKQQDAAWALIQYLGSAPVQKKRAVYDTSFPPLKSLSRWAVEDMDAMPADVRQTAWDALRHGKLPVSHQPIRGAEGLDGLLAESFVAAFAGTKSVRQVLEEVRKPIDSYLQQQNAK